MIERPAGETERVTALLRALKEVEMERPRSVEVRRFLGLLLFGRSMKEEVTLADGSATTYIDWEPKDIEAAMNQPQTTNGFNG